VPVSYKIIKDKPGYLEIDEPMATVIQECFKAFLREGCLSHAAMWLNNQGVTLKKQNEGGGRFKRVGHFTVDNLQGILRLKAYLGIKEYTHKNEKKEVKAVWPPIIDEVTFTRANQLLDKNKSRYKPFKNGKFPYLLSSLMFCKCCGTHMPGKSATGRGGKVGYYEHAWGTKRDSTLSKKIFRCEPHRVPSKKLEPMIWEKVKSFVTEPDFIRDVFTRVIKQHEENPHQKDRERLKAKISGINSQIDALSERLSELPKTVSAQLIYKHMEKLQMIKVGYENDLVKLDQGGKTSFDRIVGLETFNTFAHHYRQFVMKDAEFIQRKKLVKKFVKKVEVGTESVKIHFIVDQDHYSQELALKKVGSGPLGPDSDFFKSAGSYSLTVGAPGRT
jgi:Recombinase/Recombinase zinc beta ribbon domain